MKCNLMERQLHAEYLFLMGDIWEALKRKGLNPTEETMNTYKDMTVEELRIAYTNILSDNT